MRFITEVIDIDEVRVQGWHEHEDGEERHGDLVLDVGDETSDIDTLQFIGTRTAIEAFIEELRWALLDLPETTCMYCETPIDKDHLDAQGGRTCGTTDWPHAPRKV